MRILISALAVVRGGHKTYFSNLIPQLGEYGNNHKFILMHAPWQDLFNFDLPPNFERYEVGPTHHSIWRRISWEIFNLSKILNDLDIDVYYSPVLSSALASNRTTVVDARNLNVFMRLDDQNVRYTFRNWLLGIVARIVVQRSRYIIFVSEFSRKAALQVLKIDPSKTKVIYHGTPSQFSDQVQCSTNEFYDYQRPFLLTVSTIQTHKNYIRMLEAFAHLCRRPDWGYDYLIVGAVEDELVYKQINDRIEKTDLKGRVYYLGEVEYEKLPALYRKASLVVLPSLREAFCLPIVEAMACGVPIVAADNTCMPEIGGEAAVYFNPFDIDDMTSAISSVLNDSVVYDELIKAGKDQSEKYSWADAAIKLVELFETASHNND